MLTIRHDGSQHTFTPGHDVVIGRDLNADMRIADPRISRAHLILRFEQGKWLAIDNGSVNGTFVNGYRRPVIDIHDGQSINVGNAGGPRLTFEVGQHHGGGPTAGKRVTAGRRAAYRSLVDASPRPAPPPARTHRARPAARGRPGPGAPPRPHRGSRPAALAAPRRGADA